MSGNYYQHQPQQSMDSSANYEPVYDKGYGSQQNLAGHGQNSRAPPSRRSKWLTIGLPLLILAIIAGAVVGGVVGTRHSNNSKDADNNSQNSGTGPVTASNGATQAAVSTDSNGNPVYPTNSATAAPVTPTVVANSDLSCSADSPSYTVGDQYKVRADHPRLFADASKWACLPKLIANDAYLASWNATIMANATKYYDAAPVQYIEDGGLSGSGVLDVAREVQLRFKHWGYAWKMTNNTKWVDRAWQEALVVAGNSSDISFGETGNNWNTHHFLDLAEFTLAFAYAYDWMYDAWTEDQRNAIMWSIITLGLDWGLASYNNAANHSSFGWWQTTNGNWNCVCNGGLTLGALAIASEDPTGVSSQLLALTIPNAQQNCAFGVGTDGTWSETFDYWHFGSTGHAQMAAGLLTATGSTQELLSSNPNFNKTGLYHIYAKGFVQGFNWGDCGPNKFTATANCMMFYGDQLKTPMYTLYQRERSDAPEPLSMLYYDAQVKGDWWYDLPLDHYFEDRHDSWAAFRSTWTDGNGLFAAIKAGNATGHQTHGNLDAGDFVLEAMGERWAGELCQNDYLGYQYFYSEAQDAARWLYYRCRTEGQNTIVYNGQNQIVNQSPETNFDSTGEAQQSLGYKVQSSSTAYFYADLGSTYGVDIKRGMRTTNGRQQVLLQDEFTNTAQSSEWRMHTNATITYENNNMRAILTLNGKVMNVDIVQPTSGVSFTTKEAVRAASDPPLPDGSPDLPNPGVSVLSATIPAGSTTLSVVFTPQWGNSFTQSTPPNVALSSWSLTSHN